MKELPKEFQFKCDEHSKEQCEKLGIAINTCELSCYDFYYSVKYNIIMGCKTAGIDYENLPLINLSDYIEEDEPKLSFNMGGGNAQTQVNYPILGFAKGNYLCTCTICKYGFTGDKLATMCEPCAINKLKEIAENSTKQTPDHSELIVEMTKANVAGMLVNGGVRVIHDIVDCSIRCAEETINQLKERGYLK